MKKTLAQTLRIMLSALTRPLIGTGLLIAATSFATSNVPSPHNAAKASKTHTRKQRKQRSNQEIAAALNWISDKNTKNLCQGYYKEPSFVLATPHPAAIKQSATHITAQGPAFFTEQGTSILQKNVVITQPGRIIKADKAYLFRNQGNISQIKLRGHVHAIEAGKLMVSQTANLNRVTNVYSAKDVLYHLATQYNGATLDAWGKASKAKRPSPTLLELHHATYTSCNPLNPSWVIQASYIKLDQKKGRGYARNAILKFKHIPIFYTPYYSFPIDKRRKAGFLLPILSSNSYSGYQLGIPYYFNLAPNYDATVTPTWYTNSGAQLNLLFRYLNQHSAGQTNTVNVSYLPDDKAFASFRQRTLATHPDNATNHTYLEQLKKDSNSRAFLSLNNHTQFNSSWSSDIHLNYVTDDYYLNNFSVNATDGLANQLLNQANLIYQGQHWQFTALLQGFQTLHVIDQTPVLDQYWRLPEFDLNADYPNFYKGFDLTLQNQLVNFKYSSPILFNVPQGPRLHLRPGIDLPLNWKAIYFTPQIQLDSTVYSIQNPTAEQTNTMSRNLPIFSVDSGIYLDRKIHLGHHTYLQTLEPRVFYLYVPYTDQDNLPNFDASLSSFSFDQLYSTNAFTGYDRLQNANQVSLGVTSRLLRTKDSSQLLSASLGIINYFTPPRVDLTNTLSLPIPQGNFVPVTPTAQHLSPLVATLSYYPTTRWSARASAAWDINNHVLTSYSASTTYTRDHRHTLTLGYTFIRSQPPPNYNFFNLGLGWPLSERWSALGYLNYDVGNKRPFQYFTGLQYDTCCWALRLMFNKSYTGLLTTNGITQTQFTTTYYIQVLFKGLSSFGNKDPGDIIAANLPNYQNIFH